MQASLEEDIYVEMSPYFSKPGDKKVWKLQRAIYGLKIAQEHSLSSAKQN